MLRRLGAAILGAPLLGAPLLGTFLIAGVPAAADEAAPSLLDPAPFLALPPGCAAPGDPAEALVWLRPGRPDFLAAPVPRKHVERPDLGAMPGLILPGLRLGIFEPPDPREDGGLQPRLTYRIGRCRIEAADIDVGRGEGTFRLTCPSGLLKRVE